MELQDLYKTIYEIYLKNLQFLEKHHPNIFKKVGVLSQCIDNGEHIERYELQFENTKGCFNILDKQENKYIYNENSYEYSDEIATNTDFSSENTFSLLQLNQTNDALSLNTIVRELNPIKEIINKDIDFNNRNYLKIYKYLFVGTGLGIHISSLIKKFQPNSILIIEPSIEIFRLSMFVTDYEEIAKDRQVFLSVAEQRQERVLKIKEFHSFQPYLNYVVKYNLFEIEYGNLLTDAFKVFTLDHAEVFSYKIQLLGIKRTIQRVNEEFKFLDLKEIRKKIFLEIKKF